MLKWEPSLSLYLSLCACYLAVYVKTWYEFTKQEDRCQGIGCALIWQWQWQHHLQVGCDCVVLGNSKLLFDAVQGHLSHSHFLQVVLWGCCLLALGPPFHTLCQVYRSRIHRWIDSIRYFTWLQTASSNCITSCTFTTWFSPREGWDVNLHTLCRSFILRDHPTQGSPFFLTQRPMARILGIGVFGFYWMGWKRCVVGRCWSLLVVVGRCWSLCRSWPINKRCCISVLVMPTRLLLDRQIFGAKLASVRRMGLMSSGL